MATDLDKQKSVLLFFSRHICNALGYGLQANLWPSGCGYKRHPSPQSIILIIESLYKNDFPFYFHTDKDQTRHLVLYFDNQARLPNPVSDQRGNSICRRGSDVPDLIQPYVSYNGYGEELNQKLQGRSGLGYPRCRLYLLEKCSQGLLCTTEYSKLE